MVDDGESLGSNEGESVVGESLHERGRVRQRDVPSTRARVEERETDLENLKKRVEVLLEPVLERPDEEMSVGRARVSEEGLISKVSEEEICQPRL